MPEFVQLRPNIYRLEIPFDGTWTGVILVRGEKNVLIDSAAKSADVDEWILPALKQLGLSLEDITYLACTHCHGDHVGGHTRIYDLCPSIKMACNAASEDKLKDPLKYSKLIRASFPPYSPAAPAALRGVTPDILLKDGEYLTPYLRLVTTPGHDNDTVCWLDERTNTLITGDSLQLNGTITQGTALVMDLAGYRASMRKLSELPVDCIVAGHDYLPLGSIAEGPEAVQEYLTACADSMDHYTAFIQKEWDMGDHDPASLAVKLIGHIDGVMPKFLFLPLYTVTQILKSLNLEGVFSHE